MYVHGVVEVEVKSSKEAYEIFYKAMRRKRMAFTFLNSDSSRSHSVFTIRVVKVGVNLFCLPESFIVTYHTQGYVPFIFICLNKYTNSQTPHLGIKEITYYRILTFIFSTNISPCYFILNQLNPFHLLTTVSLKSV
jgi:hypothetical protein